MKKYAENTTVPAERSRSEIETVLHRYGASGFLSGWTATSAFIMFELHERRIKFILPMPDRNDVSIVKMRAGGWKDAPKSVQEERYQQEIRRRWRSLSLAIKAKLEIVTSGIATLEEEFMAHVVLPNGKTVGEEISPQLEIAYQTKQMPPLLGSGAGR